MEYISDKITLSIISTWKMGDKILITAQTGSGKSHFVKTNLYKYCKANNLKCLLLSNRTILKNQNSMDLDDKLDTINPMNYQEIENSIIQDDEKTIEFYFNKFDFIVMDEAHYLFTDSQFNRRTDLLLETLYRNYPNKIIIFITATPEILLEFQPAYSHLYTLKKDYSYIENIFFYSKSDTAEAIIQNLPQNEKVIYFSSDSQEAYNLSQKFDGASFICSDGNKMKKYSSQNTIKEIINKSSFSERILCTTKVLDNGINIIDREVKHVIIDVLDVITLIQCLGRKRIIGKDDKINLYVKNHHGGDIHFALMETNSRLAKVLQLDEVGVEEFQKRHRKKSFYDIVDNDFTINKAKLQFYQYQKEVLEKMKKEKDGYKNAIIQYLNFETESVQNADNEFEKIGIKSYLQKIKNKKMFKDEQEDFKIKFFNLLFSPKNTNYRHRGSRSINAILEEDNIPYRLTTGQETKGKMRKKGWWAIIEIV